MSEPLAQHDGYACKLSVHPETPNEFLSTGSDGKIFSIDIRENGPNELFVLYEDERVVPLYSINSNPLNCNEFCVSGSSRYVRVYDRRNILLPLYKFCPSHLVQNEDMYVPCAIYNYSGTEILATYDNYIYLFDRLTPSSTDYAHKYSSVTNSTIDIINFFGPKSEYVIGPSYDTIVIWDKNTETIVHETYADEEGVEYFYIVNLFDN
ncbi:DDB1- and CUL4-associated factor 8 [Trachymyrmex zeteki]|uniref:DDB1-and CUL4-associated factor 8 n=1 Tax=Mycetomoellerius zeteki TaxID=64791 RepID=A0A151X8J2_9HYME|nr:DDB1- and CUL4-associated factor 8 [Trachymyrmex zeteki]